MDIQPIAHINEIKRLKKIHRDDSKQKKQPTTQKSSNNTEQQQDEGADVQHIDERV